MSNKNTEELMDSGVIPRSNLEIKKKAPFETNTKENELFKNLRFVNIILEFLIPKIDGKKFKKNTEAYCAKNNPFSSLKLVNKTMYMCCCIHPYWALSALHMEEMVINKRNMYNIDDETLRNCKNLVYSDKEEVTFKFFNKILSKNNVFEYKWNSRTLGLSSYFFIISLHREIRRMSMKNEIFHKKNDTNLTTIHPDVHINYIHKRDWKRCFGNVCGFWFCLTLFPLFFCILIFITVIVVGVILMSIYMYFQFFEAYFLYCIVVLIIWINIISFHTCFCSYVFLSKVEDIFRSKSINNKFKKRKKHNSKAIWVVNIVLVAIIALFIIGSQGLGSVLTPFFIGVFVWVNFLFSLCTYLNEKESAVHFKHNWGTETFFKHLEDIKSNRYEVERILHCKCYDDLDLGSGGTEEIVSYREDRKIRDVFIDSINIIDESKVMQMVKESQNSRIKFVFSFVVDKKMKNDVKEQKAKLRNENRHRDKYIKVTDDGWNLKGLNKDVYFGVNMPPHKLWKKRMIIGYLLCYFPCYYIFLSYFIYQKVKIQVHLKYMKDVDCELMLKEKRLPLKDVVKKYHEKWEPISQQVNNQNMK